MKLISRWLILMIIFSMTCFYIALPTYGDESEKFYVFAAEGQDSTMLWSKYQSQVKLVKDYDALELSIVEAKKNFLDELKVKGEIEFFLPIKTTNPTKHNTKNFDWSEADGTKANIGTGLDWYWQRIHGNAFLKHNINGDGVVVVILNSGIGNPQHTLVSNNLERWYDWVNGKQEVYDDMVELFLSHGLACTGEITRSLPGVKIHLHKIHRLPDGENLLEDILEAYNQIYKDKQQDSRPYVISQSYGLHTLKEFQGLSWQQADMIFAEAEERLWNSNPDIYLIASAGNESALLDVTGRPPRYPAASPRVISVGAIKSNNEVASFSNLGATIWAPGYNILLAATMERFFDPDRQQSPTSYPIHSFYNNEAVDIASGTSFSCPLVAANVAAILHFCRSHKIPHTRTDVYRWTRDWTDQETSIIRYKDYETDEEGNRKQVVKKMTVTINQLDFENTVDGLKKLLNDRKN